MTDSSQFADLDRTLAALEQGVSTLSIDDAIALITAWFKKGSFKVTVAPQIRPSFRG